MKSLCRLTVFLVLCSLAGLAQNQKNQSGSETGPSYIVGILPFSDVSSNSDIGSLAQALPKMLQSTLLERTSLAPRQLAPGQVKKDDDSDSSDTLDIPAAAELGKAKHADLVVMGQILSGSVETKDADVSGPSFRGFSMKGSSHSQSSIVVLQVDIIDAARGQKLASFRSTGRDTEKKVDPSVESGYGSMDMTSSGFKDSSLGKASQQALNDLANKIVDTARKFTPAPLEAAPAPAKDKEKDKSAKPKKTDTKGDDGEGEG
jgi:hypothetical protein